MTREHGGQKRSSRSIPTNPNVFTTHYKSQAQPETFFQALMESTDGNIKESIEELQPLREAVVDCIEMLSEEDQFIINAVNSERLSFKELGSRLGVSKTHAWRLQQMAYNRLGVLLRMNKLVQERLNMVTTWEQSATQWVMQLASFATKQKEHNIDRLLWLRDQARTCLLDDHSAPSPFIWTEIAVEAINELRHIGYWDSGEMSHLLASKQHDYGHGNILEFGLVGVLVRLSDKIERLMNIAKNGNSTHNESKVDTLRDMVGYCVVALMLEDGTFTLNLGGDYEKRTDNGGV